MDSSIISIGGGATVYTSVKGFSLGDARWRVNIADTLRGRYASSCGLITAPDGKQYINVIGGADVNSRCTYETLDLETMEWEEGKVRNVHLFLINTFFFFH